jgi:hypothetical protein
MTPTPTPTPTMLIEVELESDGRWIAERAATDTAS